FLLTAAFVLPIKAQVAPSGEAGLVGEWISIQPEKNTVTLTQLLITKESDGWKLQASGKCGDIECDFGKVPLEVVGRSSSNGSFDQGFAILERDSTTTYLIVKKAENKLIAEAVTISRGDSENSNFRSVYVMRNKNVTDETSENESFPPSIIRRSEGLIRGNAIERPLPEYPAEAKKAGIEGDVVIELLINEEGNVAHARIKEGPQELQAAALAAVKNWKFRPTLLNGNPMKVCGVVTFRFKL